MRILYVQPADMVGGAERQGVVQIRGLRELGHYVIPVIGGPELVWLRGQLEAAGITDYVVLEQFPHVSTRRMSPRERLIEAFGNLRNLFSARAAVEKLAVERQVDAIIANCVHGWVTTGRIVGRDRRPLMWRAGTRLGTRAQRVAVSMVASVLKPSAVLPNCEALDREISPLVDCPTHLVLNGVDSKRFDPGRANPRFRSQLGLESRPVVGIAARPGPEKGMDLLADVIAIVAGKVPGVHLLVAGEGCRRPEFEARFRDRGLAGHTTFVGHVDDIESFYASCDVVVLTSRSKSAEASSNAVLEAMCMERPIVATNVCGMPEIIEDGRHGWLAGETDAVTFADRLVKLLLDEEMRRRMGRAAREKVLADFAETQAVRRLSDLLSASC